MNPADATPRQYGGLRAGGLVFAVPVDALREVLDCRASVPQPPTHPSVLGGIDLRGLLIPVVDLRLALGLPDRGTAPACIAVVAAEGRLLGIAVESVADVFPIPAEDCRAMGVLTGPPLAVTAQAFRPGFDTPVQLLSVEALLRLPGVPSVEDPGEAVRTVRAGPNDAMAAGEMLQLLLAGSGAHRIGIDAGLVEAALAAPPIERTALAVGPSLGEIRYAGRRVAVVDLLDVVGVGRMRDPGHPQVVLLRVGEGFVGAAVERIVDVAGLPRSALMPIAAFAMPGGGAFSACFEHPAFARVPAARGTSAAHALLLDSAWIHASPAFVSLARFSLERDGGEGSAQDATAAGAGAAVVTFETYAEMAAPMAHIEEILAFDPAMTRAHGGGPCLGVMVDRGRSIPVVCLAALLGRSQVCDEPDAKVLLVTHEGSLVGLAVARLRAIGQVRWRQVREPGHTQHAHITLDTDVADLARVAVGEEERMISIVDLRRMAARVVGGVPPVTGEPWRQVA